MRVWLHAVVDLAPAATVEDAVAWLREDDALVRAGGAAWGLWSARAGFGLRSDQVVIMTTWTDDATAGAGIEVIKAATFSRNPVGTPLHATARPMDTTPCSGAGVWVFREFEIDAADCERFVELSTAAWATFEARFDATIQGLFRAPDPAEGRARMLLLTRYADLATWEASRSEADDPDAWARFRERHQMTHWTRAVSAVRIDL